MKWKVIHSEAEYDAALARIEQIFHAQPGTPEGDELDLLALLVEHYEAKHYEIPPPDPIDAIKFRMGQQGLKPKDLIPIFGTSEAVKATLKGDRKLTLPNIIALYRQLDIAVETLIRPMPKKKSLKKAFAGTKTSGK